MTSQADKTTWNHSSHERFYDYYMQASQSPETLQRFVAIRDTVLRILGEQAVELPLDVADIGCGAGVQCMLWAELGHRVHGLDVNAALVELARQRTRAAGTVIDFQVGTAVQLPWPAASMDVCLVPELLEHVADWQACLNEFVRILRPGGVLYLSTTNKLCPLQQEFTLPLYSWYPGPLKRYCEHLAVTTHRKWVNFAQYPAVNWFSFYSLRAALAPAGLQCRDRFDVMDLSKKGAVAQWIVSSIQAIPVLRWLGHVATPSTTIVALKGGRSLV
jgi:2-polyprenyl-6-hydroxyphenyl methylase/3-demethylubiquinone-9 3-methyltransferase